MILNYKVSRVGEDYLIYIDCNELEQLNLDDEVRLELSSFGVSVWKTKQEVEVSMNNTDALSIAICSKLSELFSRCWDFKYGIPIVRLSGDMKSINPVLINTDIVVYFVRENVADELKYWKEGIRFIPKIIFITECCGGTWTAFRSHDFVYGWLEAQKKLSTAISVKESSDKITDKLVAWFPNENMRESLMSECEKCLVDFCTRQKLDIYIPRFMVVEQYWARRYKISTELLNNKYDPEFIMSLPVSYKDKQYTMIFPILQKLNKSNYKGF